MTTYTPGCFARLKHRQDYHTIRQDADNLKSPWLMNDIIAATFQPNTFPMKTTNGDEIGSTYQVTALTISFEMFKCCWAHL